MFVVGNLITTIASLGMMLIQAYTIVIIVSAIVSWVNPDPYNPFVRVLRSLTEPIYYRIRKMLPFVYINGLDLSPIVLLVVLQLINGVVFQSLYQFGKQM